MKYYHLTEKQLAELTRVQRIYNTQARRCRESKAYLAAIIMTGAALEAALIAFCHLYP